MVFMEVIYTVRPMGLQTGLEITFPASGLAGLLGGTDVMRILSISLHIFHSGFQRYAGARRFCRNPSLINTIPFG